MSLNISNGFLKTWLNYCAILSYLKSRFSHLTLVTESLRVRGASNLEIREFRLVFLDEARHDRISTEFHKFKSEFYTPQIDQHALISIKLQRKLRNADLGSRKLTSENLKKKIKGRFCTHGLTSKKTFAGKNYPPFIREYLILYTVLATLRKFTHSYPYSKIDESTVSYSFLGLLKK